MNLSPKGIGSLRVVDASLVPWLNVAGGRYETAAPAAENPRMTIMIAAMEGDPMILRLHGKAKAIHHGDTEWDFMAKRVDDGPKAYWEGKNQFRLDGKPTGIWRKST